MKFGKHLQKRQLDIPEYAASFVNYKALKKLIKQLIATPTISAQNAGQGPGEPLDPQTSLQANKAKFFFRLERELEKVNAFYLQKEGELKLRLKTLLDKKKVMQSRQGMTPKKSTLFVTLEEGFQQFGNDLNKLQQFVEVNAMAFSKILKKWDKASKSRTKELYLSRAVEVQPCFNRDVISDLSDQATTSRLELDGWAEGEKVQDVAARAGEHSVPPYPFGIDENDADAQLLQAAASGNIPLLRECTVRLKGLAEANGRLTRAFLAAISDAPIEALEILVETGLVDLQAEDEINERNCLHEAAISGRQQILEVGIAREVNVTLMDVYGRLPLHYACLHGHVDMVKILLQVNANTINSTDHDNFTPLIHSIIHRQFRCANQLLLHGARIDPASDTDHVPLNLACQYGAVDIVRLLLDKRASIIADAEGLYPQHLVARKGVTPGILLILQGYGANLDQRDKLYQWTPLFHAASEGFVDCVKVLLDRGADPTILDEKGLSAMYYATWEGHLECMRLLSSTGGRSGLTLPPLGTPTQKPSISLEPLPRTKSIGDGIPDLSLPPPIIPLRRYGHNFLDNKTFIQLSFEADRTSAIKFDNGGKYPAARLTISSKSSDLVPRNIMIPIQEDSKITSFQVDNLDTFAIDFDIYPSFGSKVIARTVALSSVFTSSNSSLGRCCLPLFDTRLRAIGQLCFDFQLIRPFQGIPLEIAQFETYWKMTSQIDTQPNTLITGSSLSGEYVQLFVQLSADNVPVVYSGWYAQYHDIGIPVSRFTVRELQTSFNAVNPRELQNKTADDLDSICQILKSTVMTLKEALAYLPIFIHVSIQVLCPLTNDVPRDQQPNVNNFADAILKDVFEHARDSRGRNPDFMRSIIFSSYNPDMCTALNWKQPNYPVLLRNDDGAEFSGALARGPTAEARQIGHNGLSVKEAVRLAQSNNFMGLICSAKLLRLVPALVESVKVAGLVLVSSRTGDPEEEALISRAEASRGYKPPEGVDGVLFNDTKLKFHETIDM